MTNILLLALLKAVILLSKVRLSMLMGGGIRHLERSVRWTVLPSMKYWN